MTDHAELRRVAALAHPDAEWFIARNLDHPNIDKPAASFIATATPKAVFALLDEIDRLKAENEALRKDAARYRWLIASAWYVGPEPKGDTEAVSWHDHNDTMHGVTAAIDAAIEGATQ
ncbi:hypothetical protein [Pseudomonas aeruginosa]|uniref:hypothetical protein n=1 Tax=Pseudomonas aeruginosa TaxID=287 RepID=UPI001EEE2068|nr:hypothetical protein [Pseudomonas aeruginosa]MCG7128228.1 hypothetical protein [Pseudomonas aeruginosa]MCG7153894.1 hypothetical protein [Pseudomonas aeruginosa]MCG7168930.1 hypothetical protein [Pseudomonas aeruginosa]MCG7172364.1 hypothetical protein [Pseudomonas aeruginosa]HDP4810304.1 hypothetical protein [Pseudomonas aeruginosa]